MKSGEWRTARRGYIGRRAVARLPVVSLNAAILLLLLAGCSRDINTSYGQRDTDSVNGTAVFGKMVEQAGHRVSSWKSLSPQLEQAADCIVWMPDDFQPPREDACSWLEKWLTDAPDRTLIYVGRDFDAAIWYWEHVLPDAPLEQQDLLRDRLAKAKADYAAERQPPARPGKCRWFTVKAWDSPREVRSLKGDAQWLQGIDASRSEIVLNGRMSPEQDADILLRSGRDPLVSVQRHGDSKLILVTNGSFLLNLPLVNHENRKLADKLINEIGSPGLNVAFLESRFGGPRIVSRDSGLHMPTGWEMFHIWPTNWILLHLAALGIIFCFARWPIFGRPRRIVAAGGSDFGRHVEALAKLLKRSRDRAFAKSKIREYRKTIHP